MGSHNDDNEPRVASSRRSFDFAVRPLLRQVPERLERPLPERTFPERLLVSCFPFFRPVIHTADPVPSLEAADDVSVRLADANHALHDNENDEDGNNGDARGGSYARSLLPRVIGSLCRCLPWHWTGNENHGVARRLGEAATLGSNQIARRLGKASDKQAGGDEDGETATGETEEEVRREGQNEAKGKGVKEVKREGEKEVREEGEEEEPPVYLRFENQTEATVNVLWLSHTGEERCYFTLFAAAPFTISNRANFFQNHPTQTQAAVDVLWLSHTGEEHCYFTLQPACCNTQATFEGNVWLVRDAATQKLLHHRVKVALRSSVGRRQRYLIRPRPSQQHILVGTANAAVAAASGTATADGGTTTAGAASISAGSSSKRVVMEEEAEGDVRVPSCYRQVVGTAVGVPVVAHGRVCMPALCAAADIVEHMLQALCAAADIVEHMLEVTALRG
ncbi:unnamed protein product [Closterium sp. NIES-65]|nr:unnamed protein product [Closterium sp. NIES-65]